MFIYHFNRLIHNKIVWGCFAVVIAVSFVLVGSTSMSDSSGSPVAGTLNGKKIHQSELGEAEVAVRMNMRRMGDMSATSDQIHTQALVRLSMQQLAKQAGLETSLGELRHAIYDMREFYDENGRFSHARYQQLLRFSDMTPQTFEPMVRQDLMSRKVSNIISAGAWVSRAELQDVLANATDKFTLQYATLKDEFAGSDMDVSDEAVRTFYENHKEVFALPDRYAVEYVAVPVTNYVDKVDIHPVDIEEFYDDNLERYTIEDPASTNGEPRMLTIEEVTPSITAELKTMRAREAAQTNATITLLDIAQKSMAQGKGLGELAGLLNLPVQKTQLFGTEGPTGIESRGDFVQTMMEDGEFQMMLGSVGVYPAQRHVYIFTPFTNVTAHVPPLEEIQGQVKNRAREQAKADAFKEQTEAVHGTLETALAEGKSFEEAAKGAGLDVSTNLVMVVSELVPSLEFPEAFTIAQAAMTLQTGGLSKPAPARDGALFVYMAAREPGDAMLVDSKADDVAAARNNRVAELVTQAWYDNLEQTLKFVTKHSAGQPVE